MSGIRDFFRAVFGICDTDPLDPGLWRVEGGRASFKAGDAPALAAPGGAVYLKGQGLKHPILIMRDADNHLRAYVNRCTHGGRKLDPWDHGSQVRCCSVNHSLFDLDGKLIKGPAKGPLSRLELDEVGGEVVVEAPQA